MGVVHAHGTAGVPVRRDEDDGLRIVIRDAIVQVGPVIRDIGCVRGMYVDDGPASALRMCSNVGSRESCGSREQCDKDKRKDARSQKTRVRGKAAKEGTNSKESVHYSSFQNDEEFFKMVFDRTYDGRDIKCPVWYVESVLRCAWESCKVVHKIVVFR